MTAPQKILLLFALSLMAAAGSPAQDATWTKLPGPFMERVNCFTSNARGIVYAGTTSGLFRSTDAGARWTRGMRVMDRSIIQAMTPIWYAGLLIADIPESDYTVGRLFFSGDYGATLGQFDGGELNGDVILSLYSPPFSPVVYAGMAGEGVYVSGWMGGGDWHPANDGLGNDSVTAIEGIESGWVFAGTANGIYRTDSLGAHWVLSGLSGIRIAAITADAHMHLFAASAGAIYRSSDEGVSWEPLASGFSGRITSLASGDSGRVYAGCDGSGGSFAGEGIYVSTDEGQSWHSAGLRRQDVTCVAIVESTSIYAGTASNGIFKSTDHGSSWKRSFPSEGDLPVRALKPIPGGDLLAGTGLGLYRSFFGATTWDLSYYVSAGVAAIARDGISPLYLETQGEGILRGWQYDDYWDSSGLGSGTVLSLAASPTDSNAYAGLAGHGLYRTTDLGTSWRHFRFGDTTLFALLVTPAGNFFAGLAGRDGGIFRALAGDSIWARVDSGLDHATVSVLAAGVGGELFAGTLSAGVYRSVDNGSSWVQSGLFSERIEALVIDPPATAFAAVTGKGVYASHDHGATWDPLNTGLSTLSAHCLALSDARVLYAGTDDGIYRSNAPTSSADRDEQPFPEDLSLRQNYPNPFNPSTTIEFSLPHAAHVTLTIYDLLGEDVASLLDGDAEAGVHKIAWDSRGAASGVYFCRITADGLVRTTKLVLMR